ncbi:hypothetical protein ACQCX2_08370 [Propionibacteriaceae bacterium Y1700]|uniref:hypothetical protein n=1 Tax=Microlunatus sp. Y1700 TaxID=3418487 RepID=UPI003DA6D0AD
MTKSGQDGSLAAFAAGLPDPAELERRFRALGIIEAVLTDHDFKYFYTRSFLDRPERIGRYDSGAGDTIFAFFADHGAFVRAFDHEDDTSPYATGELWPGLLDGLPEPFRPLVAIGELEDEDWVAGEDEPTITLAVWTVGDHWQHGNPQPGDAGEVPEPTTWMFHLLAGDFTAQEIAEDFGRYFGTAIDPAALAPFLELQPLTRERALAVNPEPNWDILKHIAERAGYPSELADVP